MKTLPDHIFVFDGYDLRTADLTERLLAALANRAATPAHVLPEARWHPGVVRTLCMRGQLTVRDIERELAPIERAALIESDPRFFGGALVDGLRACPEAIRALIVYAQDTGDDLPISVEQLKRLLPPAERYLAATTRLEKGRIAAEVWCDLGTKPHLTPAEAWLAMHLGLHPGWDATVEANEEFCILALSRMIPGDLEAIVRRANFRDPRWIAALLQSGLIDKGALWDDLFARLAACPPWAVDVLGEVDVPADERADRIVQIAEASVDHPCLADLHEWTDGLNYSANYLLPAESISA
jgi:hypothetical protein